MDSFSQRAVGILETAQMGAITDMTVLFDHNGALRLTIGPDALLPDPVVRNAGAQGYRLTRRGNHIQVAGFEGSRSCFFEAEAYPVRQTLLLNDQPLYSVFPAVAALPAAAIC